VQACAAEPVGWHVAAGRTPRLVPTACRAWSSPGSPPSSPTAQSETNHGLALHSRHSLSLSHTHGKRSCHNGTRVCACLCVRRVRVAKAKGGVDLADLSELHPCDRADTVYPAFLVSSLDFARTLASGTSLGSPDIMAWRGVSGVLAGGVGGRAQAHVAAGRALALLQGPHARLGPTEIRQRRATGD
jgi:hypothetical protein